MGHHHRGCIQGRIPKRKFVLFLSEHSRPLFPPWTVSCLVILLFARLTQMLQRWKPVTPAAEARAASRAARKRAADAGDAEAQAAIEYDHEYSRAASQRARASSAADAVLTHVADLLSRILLREPHVDDGARPHERPAEVQQLADDVEEQVSMRSVALRCAPRFANASRL